MSKHVFGHLGNFLSGEPEAEAISQVILSKNVFRYNGLAELSHFVEQDITRTLQTNHARLLVNGTCALRAALLSLRPVPGNEVLIPGITFIATANAVLTCGLIPRLVDVDASGHMRADLLAAYLQNSPHSVAAVITVHLDGAGSDITAIKDVCSRFQIPLIEDTAQSFGVTRGGQYLGTFGEFGCFSFQQNKILSTGEGGALVSSNNELFERASRFSDHGAIRSYDGMPTWDETSFYGENYKVTHAMAAALSVQLSYLSRIRTSIRDRYLELVAALPAGGIVERQPEDIPLTVWIEDSGIISRLRLQGIDLKSWQPWLMESHPIIHQKLSPYGNGFPWSMKKVDTENTPTAREICARRFSLPVSLDDAFHLDLVARLRNA